MIVLSVAALVILLGLSALFSASETAFFSLSKMQLSAFKKSKNYNLKNIFGLLKKPRDLLVTILIVNIAVNILVQNIFSSLSGSTSHWYFSVLMPLILTLIFGEIVPKSIAYPRNAQFSYFLAPFIKKIKFVLTPIRFVLIKTANFVTKFCFFYLSNDKEIGVEELKITLRSSREKGMISSDEEKLVRGCLNLEQDLVKEHMCPRSAILYFDISEPLSNLIRLFVDEECSCIPVCNGDLENILGVISSSSFFLHRSHFDYSHDIIPFLTKVHFIPESMKSHTLLKFFYANEETIAVVVDEYGSVSGCIFFEDLVEAVIGQISDKRDVVGHFSRPSRDIVVASGKLELTEFEEVFDIHLSSPNNMATIGGYLTELHGDIPQTGTKIKTSDFLFHILSADNKRVSRVYIRRLNSNLGKNYE